MAVSLAFLKPRKSQGRYGQVAPGSPLVAGKATGLIPNPPKDTDGRREDSGRVGEGATGEMAGLHWGRLEVGGRSSVAA